MMPAVDSSAIRERRAPSFDRQIPTIREMLGSLDTLTVNGRQHLMTKVVGFLREYEADVAPRIGRHNQRIVLELLDRLAAESKRPMPDVQQFAHWADDLVALLTATPAV